MERPHFVFEGVVRMGLTDSTSAKSLFEDVMGLEGVEIKNNLREYNFGRVLLHVDSNAGANMVPTHLMFSVEDVASAREYMEHKGLHVFDPPWNSQAEDMFMAEAADGHVFCICQRS